MNFENDENLLNTYNYYKSCFMICGNSEKLVRDMYEDFSKGTTKEQLTALVLSLNHMLRETYELGRLTIAKVYEKLRYKAQEKVESVLTGENLKYYYRMTD